MDLTKLHSSIVAWKTSQLESSEIFMKEEKRWKVFIPFRASWDVVQKTSIWNGNRWKQQEVVENFLSFCFQFCQFSILYSVFFLITRLGSRKTFKDIADWVDRLKVLCNVFIKKLLPFLIGSWWAFRYAINFFFSLQLVAATQQEIKFNLNFNVQHNTSVSRVSRTVDRIPNSYNLRKLNSLTLCISLYWAEVVNENCDQKSLWRPSPTWCVSLSS